MDTTIRRPADATSVAIAVILALAPALAGAAASADAPSSAPRASARTATSRPVTHAPRHAARPRSAVHPTTAALAAPTPVAPGGLGPRRPLELALTQAEIGSILDRYPPDPASGAHSAFDDVTVRAPAELQPMRDPVHEVWGGIAAPVWALLHPSEAWRIFLPVPPK